MSITISTPEQICHTSTNKSKSKMLFSFTRTPRFSTPKLSGTDSIYQIQKSSKKMQKMNRFTCFGYGKKFDFTQQLPKTPAPGIYQSNGLFEQARKKQKGFRFGASRQNTKSQGIFKQSYSPGPGAYEQFPQRNLLSFSLKGEHGNIWNSQNLKIPGPGQYNIKRIYEKNSKDILSKQKTHRGNSFCRDKKSNTGKQNNPGPGDYQPNLKVISKMNNRLNTGSCMNKSVVFGKENRKNIMIGRAKTPGPGQYRTPSEFGHYISKTTLRD